MCENWYWSSGLFSLCVRLCDIWVIGDSVVLDALVRFIHLLLPGLLPFLLAVNGYLRTVRLFKESEAVKQQWLKENKNERIDWNMETKRNHRLSLSIIMLSDILLILENYVYDYFSHNCSHSYSTVLCDQQQLFTLIKCHRMTRVMSKLVLSSSLQKMA